MHLTFIGAKYKQHFIILISMNIIFFCIVEADNKHKLNLFIANWKSLILYIFWKFALLAWMV